MRTRLNCDDVEDLQGEEKVTERSQFHQNLKELKNNHGIVEDLQDL